MRALVLLAILGTGALALACSDDGDASDAPGYRVTVRFNESVTQADQDEANEIILAYDDEADFLIQESFPPTGVARLRSTDPDVCSKIQADLAGKTYLDGVECTVYDPPGGGDPDDPVSNEPECCIDSTAENEEEPVSSTPEGGDGGGPLYQIEP